MATMTKVVSFLCDFFLIFSRGSFFFLAIFALTTRFSYPLHLALYPANNKQILLNPNTILNMKWRFDFTQWFFSSSSPLSRNKIFLHTELFFPFCEPTQLFVFATAAAMLCSAVLQFSRKHQHTIKYFSVSTQTHIHTLVTRWFSCVKKMFMYWCMIACDSIAMGITVCHIRQTVRNKDN